MNRNYLPVIVAATVAMTSLGLVKVLENRMVLSAKDPLPDTPDIVEQPRDGTNAPSREETAQASNSAEVRLSSGEKILIQNEQDDSQVPSSGNSPFLNLKQQGVAAFQAGDYDSAVDYFEEALQNYKNAPETLIYLNNARIGNEQAYTIAVAVPIGKDEKVSKEMLRGAAHVQQSVNLAGGIKDVPVKIVITDDASDSEIGKEVAQSLAAKSEILGVVGHFTSDVTLAASEIYEQEKLVMISPTATSVELSDKGKFIFRSVPSDRFNARALVRHMLEGLNLNKAVIFYNSESKYSSALRQVFRTDLVTDGGEVVAEHDLKGDNFNANSAMEEALAEGAEALILFHNSGVLELGLNVLEANQRKLPILSGDSGYRPEFLQVGNLTEGIMTVAAPWHILGFPDSTFPQQARELWGGDVSWRTAMTFDATTALVTALESGNTRETVQAALAGKGFSVAGVANDISFLPSGDRDDVPQLVKIEKAEGKGRSSYGYDFIPIKSN